MAPQNLTRFCPKSSSAPSIPIVKQPFSFKFPPLPSSSCPSILFQSLEFPSRAFHRISIVHKEVCSGSWRRLWCSSSSSTAEPKESHEVRDQVTVRRKKLAVFVSGGGSNFRSIHEASKRGSLHGDVLVLVTNKSECGGAEYARSNGIPVILFPNANDEANGLSPNDLVDTLRFSGPTIHFVDEHYDTGRILAQRVVPVLANDTAEELAARVLKEEHELYVEVVEALCEEHVVWREDGVLLIQSKENPNKFY